MSMSSKKVLDFKDWSNQELASYLVDKDVYHDVESALQTDREDLVEECEDEEEREIAHTVPTDFTEDMLAWIDDGNAVEIEPDTYIEQTTQWKRPFTKEELILFYYKEFVWV